MGKGEATLPMSMMKTSEEERETKVEMVAKQRKQQASRPSLAYEESGS
jgi:hypothetical protein